LQAPFSRAFSLESENRKIKPSGRSIRGEHVAYALVNTRSFSSTGQIGNNNNDSKNNKINGNDSDKVEDTSTKGKLKLMWKKYGFIFIGTYLSVYASTLVSIFFLGK
jgi:hypothetical protein